MKENEYLEEKKEIHESKQNSLKEEAAKLETEQVELKQTLYSRFGNTINLDD